MCACVRGDRFAGNESGIWKKIKKHKKTLGKLMLAFRHLVGSVKVRWERIRDLEEIKKHKKS